MKKKFISLNNQKIAYLESGKGLVMLILHGWGISSDYYVELQSLLDKNFHVLGIDFPGFGGSELPKGPFSVSDYAEIVHKFLDKKKIKKYLILAHSFGGRVALKIAAKNPQGLKGLILTGCAGIKPRKSLKRWMIKMLAKGGKCLSSLPFLKRFSAIFKKIIYGLAGAHDYEGLKEPVMKETFRLVVEEDLRPLLKKIKVPTLLLWGRKDGMTPLKDGIMMSKEIKQATLKVFEDCGHRLPYEKAKDFAQEVFKWLANIALLF